MFDCVCGLVDLGCVVCDCDGFVVVVVGVDYGMGGFGVFCFYEIGEVEDFFFV